MPLYTGDYEEENYGYYEETYEGNSDSKIYELPLYGIKYNPVFIKLSP